MAGGATAARLVVRMSILRSSYMCKTVIGLSRFISAVGLLAGACTIPPPVVPSLPEAAPQRVLARLEPSAGTLFGASLDWSDDSAESYAERLGHASSVYV